MLRERGIVLLKETHPRISCEAFLRVNMLRFFFGVTYLQSDSRRLPSEMWFCARICKDYDFWPVFAFRHL